MIENRALTIAVYSQFEAGHIPTYHRLYVEKFSAQGCRVIDLSTARASFCERIWRKIRSKTLPPSMDAWKRAARRVRQAEALAASRIDAVFLVYGDIGFVHPEVLPEEIPKIFPWPWACVLNGPAAIRGMLQPFPLGERAFAATNCRAVVVTDPSFVPRCRKAWPDRVVLAMPEATLLDSPVPSARLAEFRDFSAGRRVVGLLGVISAKKNIEAFMALARKAEQSHEDIVFVIAGDFSSQACPSWERKKLRKELSHLPSNCRIYPAPIPDGSEFNAWVSACDVIWLAYRDVIYNSNMLTKAACFGKSVLVSPGHIMARHVSDFCLGEVVAVGDVEGTLSALKRLLAASQPSRRFADYARLNAPERLDDTVRDLLVAFRE